MDLWEIFGVLVFLYFFVSLILWVVLDCNIELSFKEKFGKPISSMQGKVVWITGAASGIGRQLAITFAENGVRLCICDIQEAELEAVKQECLAVSNLKSKDIFALKMDMLDFSKHEECFNKVIEYFGQLDVLVNNAGRAQRAKWHEININVDRELFELDVFSAVNLSRVYVNYIEKTGVKGHIAVTSSMVSLMAWPNSASYTAAKYAVNGYFEALKMEMPHINVTIFCPGPTFTNFLQNSFTQNHGEKYGIPVNLTDKRMPAKRCTFLMATAIANELHMSFVGLFPIPLMMYICCCYPNVKLWLQKRIGVNMLDRLRDSK